MSEEIESPKTTPTSEGKGSRRRRSIQGPAPGGKAGEAAGGSPGAFRDFRERLNERIREAGNLTVNRFFALDSRAYEPGALDAATKELLGLVASMVLRCDDCVSYHLLRCREEGWTDEELFDAFAVALVVGGSIVIPHLRRAVEFLDELPSPGSGGEPRRRGARKRERPPEREPSA